MGLRPAHACLVLCTTAALAAAVTAQMADLISAFPLDEIRLEADSMFGKAMTLNRDYMLSLDTEQLLHTFRLNAGLQTSAAPYSSSWEDPSCEVRGQFMGHYLSALAMLGKHTGPADACMLCFHRHNAMMTQDLSTTQLEVCLMLHSRV